MRVSQKGTIGCFTVSADEPSGLSSRFQDMSLFVRFDGLPGFNGLLSAGSVARGLQSISGGATNSCDVESSVRMSSARGDVAAQTLATSASATGDENTLIRCCEVRFMKLRPVISVSPCGIWTAEC